MLLKNHKTCYLALTISMLFSTTFFCNAQGLVDPLTPANSLPVGPTGNNLVLSFSDEFNVSGAPNSSRWGYQDGIRKGNATGPDGYWSKEDAYNELGNLVIRLRAIPNKNPTVDSDSTDYSCGAIVTQGKFTQLYGKYEICCQLPTKSGWWVAFWMMQGVVPSILDGGIDGSEVDIMEGFGWTNKINHAIHYDGYGANHKAVVKQTYDTNLRTGFHKYTLEWSPTAYDFYIDGKKVWTTTGGGICTKPGYLLVTGEISTEPGLMTSGWASKVIPSSYPDYFLVDYVRVWKENATAIEPINDNNQNKLQVILKGNKVHFNASSIITSLNVYDITGKAILKSTPNENSHAINLSKGIYVVESTLTGGEICRKKFVVI